MQGSIASDHTPLCMTMLHTMLKCFNCFHRSFTYWRSHCRDCNEGQCKLVGVRYTGVLCACNCAQRHLPNAWHLLKAVTRPWSTFQVCSLPSALISAVPSKDALIVSYWCIHPHVQHTLLTEAHTKPTASPQSSHTSMAFQMCCLPLGCTSAVLDNKD